MKHIAESQGSQICDILLTIHSYPLHV